jgi:hypothetical protein
VIRVGEMRLKATLGRERKESYMQMGKKSEREWDEIKTARERERERERGVRGRSRVR